MTRSRRGRVLLVLAILLLGSDVLILGMLLLKKLGIEPMWMLLSTPFLAHASDRLYEFLKQRLPL